MPAHRTPRTDIEPLAVSVNDSVPITGFCRSQIYKFIAAGQLKTKKSGRRRIIEMSELRRFIANLPEAGSETMP